MRLSGLVARLVPRRAVVDLMSFEHDVARAGGVVGRVDRGLRTVPTAEIVGSLDRWRTLRGDFLYRYGPPIGPRHRRIAELMQAGAPLPPLELYQIVSGEGGRAGGGRYYVLDGHHRVAMARRLGQEFVDAHVVEYRLGARPLEPGLAKPAHLVT
jgi:hypothetical protein